MLRGAGRRPGRHFDRLGGHRLRQGPGDHTRGGHAGAGRLATIPEPEETTALVEDPFSAQLRQSAAAQAKAIAATGTFTQSHEPKETLGGLRLKDGSGAIVFTHLVRTDNIAMRQPTKLTPSKDLTLLTGIKQITSEASLHSNQIVAMVIPVTGAAQVVAGWDQLVGGAGR